MRRPAPRTTRNHGHVAVIGGGLIGQLSAILLARDGHRVTLLERDPAPPPADLEACWSSWTRRGVNQFRLPHALLPRFRQTIEAELPELVAAMTDAGCLRLNPLAELPVSLSGGTRPGDERFEMLTARRPIAEAVVARMAASTPGLTVRRGVAVAGLLVDHDRRVPHVRAVRTSAGDLVDADVFIDAAGRRSPFTELLQAAGTRRPIEQVDDVGYVYYGRDFHNADGSLPAFLGPLNHVHDSHSVLTLPADHGWWSVVIVASAADRALRRAADVATWQRLLDHSPLARHWTEADHATDVTVIRRLEDRWRSLIVDGEPVATGVLSVGDAWACTNPSVGRGVSIGTMHAVALRDHLREALADDPVTRTLGWAACTAAVVEPYWADTHRFDQHRLRQIDAQVNGRSYEPDDPGWRLGGALAAAARQDPEMMRHLFEITTVLSRGIEVLSRPGVAGRALELSVGAAPPPGPNRAELLELLADPVAAG